MPKLVNPRSDHSAIRRQAKIQELSKQYMWLCDTNAPQIEMDRVEQHVKALMDAIK